jgi:hypothetical protein
LRQYLSTIFFDFGPEIFMISSKRYLSIASVLIRAWIIKLADAFRGFADHCLRITADSLDVLNNLQVLAHTDAVFFRQVEIARNVRIVHPAPGQLD